MIEHIIPSSNFGIGRLRAKRASREMASPIRTPKHVPEFKEKYRIAEAAFDYFGGDEVLPKPRFSQTKNAYRRVVLQCFGLTVPGVDEVTQKQGRLKEIDRRLAIKAGFSTIDAFKNAVIARGGIEIAKHFEAPPLNAACLAAAAAVSFSPMTPSRQQPPSQEQLLVTPPCALAESKRAYATSTRPRTTAAVARPAGARAASRAVSATGARRRS